MLSKEITDIFMEMIRELKIVYKETTENTYAYTSSEVHLFIMKTYLNDDELILRLHIVVWEILNNFISSNNDQQTFECLVKELLNIFHFTLYEPFSCKDCHLTFGGGFCHWVSLFQAKMKRLDVMKGIKDIPIVKYNVKTASDPAFLKFLQDLHKYLKDNPPSSADPSKLGSAQLEQHYNSYLGRVEAAIAAVNSYLPKDKYGGSDDLAFIPDLFGCVTYFDGSDKAPPEIEKIVKDAKLLLPRSHRLGLLTASNAFIGSSTSPVNNINGINYSMLMHARKYSYFFTCYAAVVQEEKHYFPMLHYEYKEYMENNYASGVVDLISQVIKIFIETFMKVDSPKMSFASSIFIEFLKEHSSSVGLPSHLNIYKDEIKPDKCVFIKLKDGLLTQLQKQMSDYFLYQQNISASLESFRNTESSKFVEYLQTTFDKTLTILKPLPYFVLLPNFRGFHFGDLLSLHIALSELSMVFERKISNTACGQPSCIATEESRIVSRVVHSLLRFCLFINKENLVLCSTDDDVYDEQQPFIFTEEMNQPHNNMVCVTMQNESIFNYHIEGNDVVGGLPIPLLLHIQDSGRFMMMDKVYKIGPEQQNEVSSYIREQLYQTLNDLLLIYAGMQSHSDYKYYCSRDFVNRLLIANYQEAIERSATYNHKVQLYLDNKLGIVVMEKTVLNKCLENCEGKSLFEVYFSHKPLPAPNLTPPAPNHPNNHLLKQSSGGGRPAGRRRGRQPIIIDTIPIIVDDVKEDCPANKRPKVDKDDLTTPPPLPQDSDSVELNPSSTSSFHNFATFATLYFADDDLKMEEKKTLIKCAVQFWKKQEEIQSRLFKSHLFDEEDNDEQLDDSLIEKAITFIKIIIDDKKVFAAKCSSISEFALVVALIVTINHCQCNRKGLTDVETERRRELWEALVYAEKSENLSFETLHQNLLNLHSELTNTDADLLTTSSEVIEKLALKPYRETMTDHVIWAVKGLSILYHQYSCGGDTNFNLMVAKSKDAFPIIYRFVKDKRIEELFPPVVLSKKY